MAVSFILVNKEFDNLLLTATDDNTVIGAPKDDDSRYQTWEFIRVGEDVWTIRNKGNGKNLATIPGVHIEPGTQVVVIDQEYTWRVPRMEDNFVKLVIDRLGFNAELSDGAPNTPVTLFFNTGKDRQVWNMIPVF